MIKITAKVDETGTSVRMKELSGKLDDILDETAGIVASVVGNILANGTPQGVRPKEFEAFIMQQINKRTKESLEQLLGGVVDIEDNDGVKQRTLKDILKDRKNGIDIQPTPKKRTIRDIIQDRRDGIDVQPEDEKKYFN